MAEPLRIALVGAGRRAEVMYAPLCRMVQNDLEVVAVWSRSEAKAQSLAQHIGAPAYTDLERMVRETQPQAAIVSVSGRENGAVGLQAVAAGLSVLLETPIALAVRQSAEQGGIPISVGDLQ